MPVMMLSYCDTDGQRTWILDRASTSIGRSAGQDVVLHDPGVSRHHAVIERDGDIYTVVDQGSTRGTFLNGVRVEREVLKPEDVLQMGSVHSAELRFHLPEGHGSANTAYPLPADDLLTSIRGIHLPGGEVGTAAREMGQLKWLLQAARQLNQGGAIEEVLGVLLRLTLQLTGLERGFVFLCEDGEIRFAQGLGAQGRIVEEDSSISRQAMQTAIHSELKFSVSDTLAHERVSEWSSVLANQIRSIYCIPLRKPAPAREPARLLGLLYLDSQIRPGRLSEVDHQLLDTIATEAAALLHNALLAAEDEKARHAREELAFAARIHQGLMSNTLPDIPYAVLRAKSVPCLAIGGDFFDVVALDECVCVTVVDVSGKGIPAAIVAATLQGILHAQLLAGQSLAQVASMVNLFLCTRDVGKYATMVIVRLFPDGQFEYLNCGHIQPLVISGAEVRQLRESNLIVGLVAEASYTTAHDRLRPGERILLATDGLTEAENTLGELFGESGLTAIAQLDEIDAMLEHVAGFHAPNPAQDDMTLIDVRYHGNN